MAEVVLADKLAEAGLDVEVDSAAVSAEELGNPIDYRAARTLTGGGYDVPSRRARQVRPDDFQDFDLVLPMTRQHERVLQRMISHSGGDAEIMLYRQFVDDGEQDVPDPWYGNQSDFDETLQIIEEAVPAIIRYVRENS